jgi:hypothetical protein
MTKKLTSPDLKTGNGGLSIRQANVEAFLDAAERVLVRDGAAGISTRQLATEAGRILDRQRAMYGADAPFAEKWRTAMGYIEEDLASGYPKVWLELEALAWNRPEMRERLCEVNDAWRSLLHDAFAQAIEEYGLDQSPFSAEAWATLVMQFNKGLLTERLLGFDRSHAELLAAIDGWLTELEKRKA